MKNYAIISEFNPFHKGHQYLTEQCRQSGATHITAIMSGNYVQRGDVAILPKHIRTKMALECGVDLVLELPLPYAVSNAQVFARGGVQTAYLSGCVDKLAFGSECGNIKSLEDISRLTTDESFQLAFKKEIAKGVSYPTALTNTASILGNNNLAEIISSPNNVLGIEYVKAINEIKDKTSDCKITPVTFQRIGDSHNSQAISSTFASASNIRKLIKNGEAFIEYLPNKSYDLLQQAIINNEIACLENNHRGIISILRKMSIDDFKSIADISEGLEHRIYNAVQKATSVEDILEMTCSKRYTYARIRRLLISSILGITYNYPTTPPQYIRILGFNNKGAEILKVMKKTAKVPIITKITNLPQELSEHGKKMLEIEIKSSDIYYTFTNKVQPCGIEYKSGVVVIK